MAKQHYFEAAVEEIAPHFIQSCDAILKSRLNHGIAVMGTAGRGIYSVMRKLSAKLPDRGKYRRVKLLDISRKLILGPKVFDEYDQQFQLLFTADKLTRAVDKKRNRDIFRYVEQSGLLEHDDILLIDTGGLGTVIQNLRDIIKARCPKKRVTLIMYYPTGGTARPPGIDAQTGKKISGVLERFKTDFNRVNPERVTVGFDFVRKKRLVYPKYESTAGDPAERLLGWTILAKHRILNRHVAEYVKQQKGEFT